MTLLFRNRLCLAQAIVFLGGVISAGPAWSQSNRVVSVEEHWELQIGEPDSNVSAPQTTMVMSPTGDLTGQHFLFTLNHVTVPDYQPGGMQVQLWDGEDLVQQSTGHETDALNHSNETIHWVQRLSLQNGQLTFAVVNGDSQTWSSFGGDDLTLAVPTTLNSLSSYRPAISLAESQVGFAENRVTALTLTKLIWVTEDGQVHEQDAPIPVDTRIGD